MFSFFEKRKKGQPLANNGPDFASELASEFQKLRSELADETLRGAVELNKRIDRLKSVEFSFFQSLLELTDIVSDNVLVLYQEYQNVNLLEVRSFCWSIVGTAVAASDLPKNDKFEIIDIYAGLIAGAVKQHAKHVDEERLKSDIKRVIYEYAPLIIKAATGPAQENYKEENSLLTLMANVDRLAGIKRDELERSVVAVQVKVVAAEAIRIVDGLLSR